MCENIRGKCTKIRTMSSFTFRWWSWYILHDNGTDRLLYYIFCSARNSRTNDSIGPRFIRMLRLMHKIRMGMMTDRLIPNAQTSYIHAHVSYLCWFSDAASSIRTSKVISNYNQLQFGLILLFLIKNRPKLCW